MNHRRAISMLSALAAMAPGAWGHWSLRRPRRRIVDPTAAEVACPQCGAAAGDPCEQRTLGRFAQHWARVEAARDARLARIIETDRLTRAVHRALWGWA